MPFVTSAQLHEAINSSWDAHGLDWEFKRLWAEADRSRYEALHDGDAGPETPYPYVVFEQLAGTTVTRMSGHSRNERHEIQDVPFQFRIHAKTRGNFGDDRTAKTIAAELAALIIMKYGGHPTVREKGLTLTDGQVLIAQKQTDWGVKTGDDEYSWVISYIFRLDVPVAA